MKASAIEQVMSFAFDQGREFERMKSTLKSYLDQLEGTKRELAELRLASNPTVGVARQYPRDL